MVFILFIAGLVGLIGGAELLVRGASRLAAAVGMKPLVIGLTVVAFGTSAPEFAVSIKSAYAEHASIAVGNVVGSNIFNVLFILGLSALVAPLIVSRQLIRFDVPLLIAASLLLLWFSSDLLLNRIESGILLAGLIGYLILLFRLGKKEEVGDGEEDDFSKHYGLGKAAAVKRHGLNVSMIVVGLALLVLGSRWLVNSAVTLAEAWGLNELIIGLTIVAVGTSLPEVVTSVIAGIRGERDIAVGNVIGSSLFNALGVLGLAGVISPAGIAVSAGAVRFDIPIMVAVSVACLPIFFTGHRIGRWEGALFLGYYMAYTLYLILGATDHDALPVFNATMMYFVIPLTAVTLAVITVRSARQHFRGKPQPE